MKSKKIFGIALVFLLLSVALVFAYNGKWKGSLTIINADTFVVIQEITFVTDNEYTLADYAKKEVRKDLGFSENSDTRVAGGVTQRILWGDVSPND
ncbi:MAG: hypothetical protein LBK08_00180 [Treponema sp.]|nr:hypothetical protein [Treponema sp.]